MNSPSSSQLWILTTGQAFVPGTVLINEGADLIDCVQQTGLWESIWHTNLPAHTHTHSSESAGAVAPGSVLCRESCCMQMRGLYHTIIALCCTASKQLEKLKLEFSWKDVKTCWWLPVCVTPRLGHNWCSMLPNPLFLVLLCQRGQSQSISVNP